MKSINSEEQKSNIDKEKSKPGKKCIYHKDFEVQYEVLSPIMKDLQMMSQLIKLFRNYQFSDIIFIIGSSTCSVNSRFYFNYRKIEDFYFLVLGCEENENSLKITYHIYKTKPTRLNFFIDISFVKSENNTIIDMEIIPPKGLVFPQKILNIIFNEMDYNFLYLSLALKLKKEKLVYLNSTIVQNEFFVLSQILQNIKLIEYLINGKLVNITDKKKDIKEINLENKHKFIHLNDVYKIKFSKLKGKTSLNDINFKIINIKSREDKLTINIKMLFDEKDKEKNDSDVSLIYNIICINLIRITQNSSFILFKCIIDTVNNGIEGNNIKKILKKFLAKIEKLSDISKNKISF